MAEKCFYDITKLKTQDVIEYPDFAAEYYDIIYDKLIDKTDLEFYLKKISECAGRILEIGAGTGRILAAALSKGADIYGIDSSSEMIRVLRGKLAGYKQNRVMIKDARDFNLGVKFDLIIMPFRVFSHFEETDDQLKVLNYVYDHLNPEGRLIFDVFVPDLKILLKYSGDNTEFEIDYSNENGLKRYSKAINEYSNQVLNVQFIYEWNEGKEKISREWNTRLRYFFRFEIENLVRLSKLRMVNIYGDFSENPVTDTSKNYIVVCRKDLLKQ